MTARTDAADDRREQTYETDGVLLVIAPVTDAETSPWLTDDDRSCIATLGNARRRREQTAWRSIVRRKAGTAPIAYTPSGAPFLEGSDLYIGVSHTASETAVILSRRPCAVDIECTGRDFRRVAPRFVAPEEAALPCSGEELFLPVLWCVKETLYKFSGRKELDLREDLRLNRANLRTGTLTGAISCTDGMWREFPMHAILREDAVCVWMAADAPDRPQLP